MKSCIKVGDKEAWVDAEDYPLLSRHYWTLHSEGYAVTALGNQYVYMHHMVLPLSGFKKVVDHIDFNKLNNTKENLRILDNLENLQHSERYKGEFVGVSYHAIAKKWRARITTKDFEKHLGLFETKEQARDARERYLKNDKNNIVQR